MAAYTAAICIIYTTGPDYCKDKNQTASSRVESDLPRILQPSPQGGQFPVLFRQKLFKAQMRRYVSHDRLDELLSQERQPHGAHRNRHGAPPGQPQIALSQRLAALRDVPENVARFVGI